MSAQLVPVTAAPNQALTVSLAVNGSSITLNLGLAYNRISGCWMMSIADQSGNPLLSSIPLLTGDWPAANILGPYEYLEIGSAFVINQSGGPFDWPNDSTLGQSFFLIWD